MTTPLSRFFQITQSNFSPDQQAEHEATRASLLIADPTEELKHIYEVNRLADLIGIRAEKYASPEFKHLLTEDGKFLRSESKSPLVSVPRTVQNPNFDTMLSLINNIRTNKDIRSLKRLVEFLENLPLPRIKAELNTESTSNFRKILELPAPERQNFDIRFCTKISEAISYFYNQYVALPEPCDE